MFRRFENVVGAGRGLGGLAPEVLLGEFSARPLNLLRVFIDGLAVFVDPSAGGGGGGEGGEGEEEEQGEGEGGEPDHGGGGMVTEHTDVYVRVEM